MVKLKTSKLSNQATQSVPVGNASQQYSSNVAQILNAVSNTQRPQVNASQPTPQELQDLKNRVNNNLNINQQQARKLYISAAVQSDGYSWSQQINYALDNDLPLTNPNLQIINQHLSSGMGALGSDMTLYRGAHQDVLQALGVNNYQNMSQAQIQQAIVGKTYTSKSFWSTASDYNSSPFLGNGQYSGGREIEFKVSASKNVRGMVGNEKQSEVILDKATNYSITNAYFSGRTASPRTSSKSLPVLVVEVDAW